MTKPAHTIYIVSGGSGASGEQVVHTVLVQFPENHVRVITMPHVRQRAQVEEIIAQAVVTGGTIVHTLIETPLRELLVQETAAHGVPAFDVMGPLLTHLSETLGQPPLEQPGLYRRLNRAYFERVAAIEYTMAHDDGQRPHGWHEAEIMLTAVSRAGKTPLSMYLAVLGWKVANLPLIMGIPTPPELFELNPHRVFGLMISPAQLVRHRQERRQRMGAPGLDSYTDYETIKQELQAAEQIFRRGKFQILDVTDRPIEASADDIIKRVTDYFGKKPR